MSICMDTYAQQKSVGIFDGDNQIGTATQSMPARYTASTQAYELSSMGTTQDESHFLWKRIKGDFIVYTRAHRSTSDAVHQIGWMARTSLEPNAPYVRAAVNSKGATSLYVRQTAGESINENRTTLTDADIIQLERRGNTYTLRAARFGEPFQVREVSDINLGDELYVGLFVTALARKQQTTCMFQDVRITVPVKVDATPGRMDLGSRLELLDVMTGKRDVIHTAPNSIQAPNWTNDGKTLIYNGQGFIYSFDLGSRQQKVLNTGEVKNNNNDHVLSFDGKTLGLSSGVDELGGSIIYTVPVTGGTPKQITPKGPSYLHGWSPDGQSLVFCGARNNEYDVYKIPADGGPEIRLTDARGLDDGPEYTPDGSHIYFNSNRTGTMQIWRMKPDGSQQEAVTNGEFHDWFPHISPDGKWIVFLSFLKDEVAAGDHPAFKHVYLRLMPIQGGAPTVIAYVYGGQGSINTPSWSPDSKRIAFISNTDVSTLSPAEIAEN
ncbi:biopolymer transporter TolR [Spirosoma agri]|uniref:Biopolymer transporter TolR n=2 Tax=Spirosoma agri TaxID=1987381 RepID=A0A6M0IEE7_9BACT|nr:biopolymer transporter TolR [Spirosoma agri]